MPDEVKTAFGFLHVHYGEDMDGSHRTFEMIKDHPQKFDMSDEEWAEYQEQYAEEKAGWFALCAIDPEEGWIGPVETKDEAILLATNQEALDNYHRTICE